MKRNLLRSIVIISAMLWVISPRTNAADFDIYFTHPYGGIHKTDSGGQVSTVLSDIGRCTGLEFDNSGNLYFGKFYEDRHKIDLMMMSPDQQVTNFGNIIEVGAVTLAFDIDLAIGEAGDVYFTHPSGGIHKVDAAGQISTVLPEVGEAASMAIADSENLYFGEYYDEQHKIDLMMMSTDQQVTNLGNIIEVGAVTLAFDIDLAIGEAGDVYFTHPYGGIHKTDSGGQVSTVLSDIGRCTGLEFDNSGNLYFGKFYEDRHKIDLMMMSPDQQVTNLGNIIEVGAVTLTWDTDLALIPKPALSVAVDIKPGSCPNPVNVKSSGVLPVAILGSADFDVTTIDATSVQLAGVGAIRHSFEDVATPISDGNDCNCITDGPDGFLDLTLKFKTQRIVEAIGDVNDGDVRVLTLTGVLFDPMPFETPIEGADCILIRGRHKPINPADINKDGVVDAADFAIFAQNWLQSSIVDE